MRNTLKLFNYSFNECFVHYKVISVSQQLYDEVDVIATALKSDKYSRFLTERDSSHREQHNGSNSYCLPAVVVDDKRLLCADDDADAVHQHNRNQLKLVKIN